MWSSIGIVVLIYSLSFQHACCDSNNSSRSPKLGPSIVEKPFNVEKDLAFIWEILSRTIDGHEKLDKYQPAIIELLTNRTLNQRNQVAEAYKEKSNNLLTWPNDLNSAFGGEIGSLFTEVKVLLHSYVQESLDLSRDWAYMSIICTSSANRIKDLNSVSFVDAKNKNDPNDPLHLKDPSLGEYIDKQLNQKGGRVVLNSILNNQRPESGIDPAKIPDQVKAIPNNNAGCKKSRKALLNLMTKESFDQIKAVDEEYRKQNQGATVLQQIDSHCEGDIHEAYRRIVSYAVDPFGYFADEFYLGVTDSNHGWISNAVSIVAFTRAETDLLDVEAAFRIKHNNQSLLNLIKDYDWDRSHDVSKYIIYRLCKGNTGHTDV